MDTSLSLIENLKHSSDDDAWRQLFAMYTPMMRAWLIRYGARPQDLDDVVQEVLAVIVRRFPEFEREPHPGAFRGWMRSITANCLRNEWRRSNNRPRPLGGEDFASMVEALEDPHSGISRIWEQEHDRHVLGFLLDHVRSEFQEKTWRAFELTTIEGKTADQAANQLEMTPNAVFVAKSRVLSRLRQRSEGLVDDSWT